VEENRQVAVSVMVRESSTGYQFVVRVEEILAFCAGIYSDQPLNG
jgi:hypothetical protein